MKMSHIPEVFYDLDKERTDATPEIAYLQMLGTTDLLNLALIQDNNSIRKSHRFQLIVRDVDHRGLQFAMKLGKLNTHLNPKFTVEIGEWFVEKKNLRFTHNCAADRDTLSLSARKVLWPPMQERCELQNLRCASHTFLDLVFWTLRHPQTEAHVLLD